MRRWLIFLWSGFWLYLCLIPWLGSHTESYARMVAGGCPGQEYCLQAPFAFVFGLWAFTTPLFAWALTRYPKVWPPAINHWFWNQSRPFFSLWSLLVWLCLEASAVKGMLTATYEASQTMLAVAAALLFVLGGWQRAILLSAPLPTHS